MAELALSVPLLLLILFAILQFGILFSNYIEVAAAAREAARTAAVRHDDDPAVAAARNAVWLADEGELDIEVTPATSAWVSGDEVTVEVSYPWDLGAVSRLVSLVSAGGMSASGTMTSTVTARIE